MVPALLFGSFLNVCIARLPEHRSIVRPGSHCPRCGAAIRPWDNVPLLSWLLLGGRCRACREPISVRYPLVEAGYAGLVAGSVARFGFTPEGLAACVFCFFVLGLLVMDLEAMLLPDAFTLPGLGLGLAWAFAAPAVRGKPGWPSDSVHALILAAVSAAGWTLLLLLIRWSYYALRRRQGLGLGDVKLIAMLAAWLGAPQTALCFLLAVVAAAAVGLAALGRQALQRESSATPWGQMRLPLGTFLCASSLYALFFGKHTLNWYLSFFP